METFESLTFKLDEWYTGNCTLMFDRWNMVKRQGENETRGRMRVTMNELWWFEVQC